MTMLATLSMRTLWLVLVEAAGLAYIIVQALKQDPQLWAALMKFLRGLRTS